MTRDVSLCIIRVEISNEQFQNSYDGSGCSTTKFPLLLENIRGKRRVCDVQIETYVPDNERKSSSISRRHVGNLDDLDECKVEPGNESGNASAEHYETVHFIAGNPFVEKFQGILHLFKEDELTDINCAGSRSQTVCILAVPASMTCTDLLTFVAACHDDIKHVRIIKDASPIQYMALITFSSSKSVIEFYKSFNGIPFNHSEPEWCCHLVFVSQVEAVREGGCIPPISHTELPTCPVCLERMDESVDGILTILCNHAFHGSSLAKWGDTSCPVCRYIQASEPNMENHCLECAAKESLWICLICGHVGCGRYLQGHAYQHYIDTHHCYSMQLGNNSVWDYVGDNFVHRILQNKTDLKLGEGPNSEKLYEVKAKINSIQLEYTYLLTAQLESQRTYYEEMVSLMKQKYDEAIEENKRLLDFVQQCKKEKSAIDKKIQALSTRFITNQKNLQDEREMNKSLVENQGLWKKKFLDLELSFSKLKIQKSNELDEIKDQVRDIMFYIDAQQKVNESAEKNEIMEGTIEVPEIAPQPSEGAKKRKSRRNKLN